MTRTTSIVAAAIAAVLASSLAGCGVLDQPLLNDSALSGAATTQQRAATGFTGIEVRGSGNLTVEAGPDFSVTVTTDSGLQDYVTTTVKNNTLVIHQKFSWLGTTPNIEYTVTLPELHALALAGSGNITATGVDTDRLRLESAGSGTITAMGTATRVNAELAGSGGINLSGLEVQHAIVEIAGSGKALVQAQDSLEVSIAGSGDVTAKGRVNTLAVSIAGSGDFVGEDLVARQADISIAGSGNVSAGVRTKLVVSIVGSGDVVYFGSPEIEFEKVGSGKVTAG
ncbi:MAG: hypothetical protein CVT64_09475 [Actinobacteria bacterium HGW-Actinobacteria-4]|nr:MAG: hypothetical protein CVT64_09475 [Actinobacteria bacterium HGW-Actinobacteria-4]